jgi:hypothetical protein
MSVIRDFVARFNSPDFVAGSIFLLSAFVYVAMWYILLFVAQPPCKSVIDAALETLAYFFSQECENRKLFIWLVVLPIICCVLAAAYLLGGARSRNGALVLLIAGAALASATVILRQSISTIFPICWAVYWGWRSYVHVKEESRMG